MVEYKFKDKYNVNDLLDIMAVLRSPGGCPWDAEQTHESIKKDFIEETYEVIEAIDNDDPVLLREELGDVLGNLPNFNLFGLNMGLTPGFQKPYLLLLVPVLTFVAYFVSMKLTRKLTFQPQAQDPQMGCSNNMMDITMPLMSVYITFITPAAIGVYWIFKCVLGVGKQALLAVAMPIPKFTDEDYAKAEKEYNAQKEKNRYAYE